MKYFYAHTASAVRFSHIAPLQSRQSYIHFSFSEVTYKMIEQPSLEKFGWYERFIS